jgi:large subunit ribosomal protein L13
MVTIIDGSDCIFGRLASQVAKRLLKGEEIYLVNAEKIIMSGDKRYIVERYKQRRAMKHKGNPEKSPKWSRVPHLFVKRLLRGMLPRKKAVGRMALRRLKVFTGDPFPDKEKEVIQEAKAGAHLKKYITIGELCKELGWSG